MMAPSGTGCQRAAAKEIREQKGPGPIQKEVITLTRPNWSEPVLFRQVPAGCRPFLPDGFIRAGILRALAGPAA
jgi:hypothetical protein